MHLTSGGTSRGTEILGYRLTEDVLKYRRNVYLWSRKTLMILGRYNKTTNKKQKHSLSPKFIHPTMVPYFCLYFGVFANILQNFLNIEKRIKNSTIQVDSDTFLNFFCVQPTSGAIFLESEFYAMFSRLFLKYFEQTVKLSQWRHIMAALGNNYLKSTLLEDGLKKLVDSENKGFHNQMGHSDETNFENYGRDESSLFIPINLVVESYNVSNKLWQLLHVGQLSCTSNTLPPAPPLPTSSIPSPATSSTPPLPQPSNTFNSLSTSINYNQLPFADHLKSNSSLPISNTFSLPVTIPVTGEFEKRIRITKNNGRFDRKKAERFILSYI